MLSINTVYSDKNNIIKITREVSDDADLKMVVGEVIYAVETQCPDVFKTHDQFENAEIPDGLTLNCTVLNVENDMFSLKVTISRKRKSKS